MSPIVVFIYKRPIPTKLMVDALLHCIECSQSELYVFADGPRDVSEHAAITQTRRLFDNIDQRFLRVHRHYATSNQGLAHAVIDGVSLVLSRHDSVIVLEDDLVVAPDFLTFMNQSLRAYHDRNDIWSISGYTPPLSTTCPHDVFLTPRAQSWGWATWRDRWQQTDWDASGYDSLSHRQRRDFDRGGNDLYRTLDMERHHKIDSWAIRWAYAAWQHHAWTVNPRGSKVQNIGLQAVATHPGWHDSRHQVELCLDTLYPDPDVQPNEELIRAFKAHHDLGLVSKLGYFMRRYSLGYTTLKRLMNAIHS